MTTTALETQLDAIFAATDTPITAESFRAGITAAIHAGVEQAGDAYAFSLHSDGHTYGTNRWRFVLAEVDVFLGAVPRARTLVSGGMKVSVVPVGGGETVLVYPLCVANDAHTSPQHLKIRPSRLRRALLAGSGLANRDLQLMLSFPDLDDVSGFIDVGDDDAATLEEDAAAEHLEAAIGELPKAPRTLVAGYASNPRGGLLKVFVGEASMAPDGTLDFSWLEELAVPAPVAADLYAVSEAEGVDRFDTAPEPSYDVIPHQDAEPCETGND